MGWTFTHKDPCESAADFLRRECLTWDLPPEARPEVIASAEGHPAIAFAVRIPPAYWDRHPEATASLDPRYQRNVLALEKTLPEDLRPSDITTRLGAPWIPAGCGAGAPGFQSAAARGTRGMRPRPRGTK